ncbi:hypothetical protein [Mesorhizobium sp. CAU 1732]|uniref:hypothetical protein n=1 Tax=Mesorhizobium sp. CAU 1732 TaxID=3140358 RepID=UPI0032600B70
MLATLLASVVSGEATEAVSRLRRSLLIYAAAALFLFCGAGFLLGAGFVTAANELGTVNAALWFAGGFIGLAIVLLIVHRITARMKAKRVARRRGTEVKAVASATAIALIPTLLAGRGRAVVLIAPAIAALAYAVYRENSRAPRTRDGD